MITVGRRASARPRVQPSGASNAMACLAHGSTRARRSDVPGSNRIEQDDCDSDQYNVEHQRH
eukprot:1802207-Pleurochrysis_carterae.AAC.1